MRIPVKGPTGKPYLTAACFDANAKANRLASAGRGQLSTAPDPSDNCLFFGGVHQELWQLHRAGPLPLSAVYTGSSSANADRDSAVQDGSSSAPGSSSTAAAAAAASDDELELDAQVEHNCHPHLSCARETSVSSGISDEHGLVGAVCAHGQPLLGLMAAMPAPERLVYYDLLTSRLQELVDLGVMYLDTGCTFSAHWRLHMPGAPRFVIKVPWWHARGHGESCYLTFSGFYYPGEFPVGVLGWVLMGCLALTL